MGKDPSATDDFASELGDFGRHPGVAKRFIYFLLASVVCCLPTGLCVRLFVVDMGKAQLTLGVGVLAGGALLSLAYHDLAFSQAARIRADSSPPTKRAFAGKPDKFEAAKQAHEKRITGAAFMYSFAYNNALFLLAAPFAASYVFGDKVSGELNALLSAAAAGALALFNSRSALKAIGE